jgi:glycosyltransferase involved in cell wall biosynthesis
MFHGPEKTPTGIDRSAPLRLCYTGRFYSFRQPDRLIEAVRSMEGVVLAVAGPEPPRVLLEAARLDPARFELHGELAHAEALTMQRSADVLVSVGNTGTVQTPGKLFEYFGAGRPVLHISGNSMDPQIGLVRALRRGLTCSDTTAAIRQSLVQLASSKRTGDLFDAFDLSAESIADYSWPRIVGQLCDSLGRASAQREAPRG